MLHEKIKQYSQEIEEFNFNSAEDIENFRLKFLVSKGIIKSLFEEFKTVSPEEKRTLGKVLNELKQLAENRLQEAQSTLEDSPHSTPRAEGDLTLRGDGLHLGCRHPFALLRKEIIEIFKNLGFVVAEGPEIEDDWHIFSALNFPPEHPSRDMQATFFIKKQDG